MKHTIRTAGKLVLLVPVLFLVLTIPKTKASVTASTREPMDPGL